MAKLGRLGIWRRRMDGTDGLADIEAAGYTAVWVGASPSVEQARPFLEASAGMTVATGILNVWQHDPGAVAAAHAETTDAFAGRFVLGLGIGHPEATAEYKSPLATMREFLDGLDAAPRPVPQEERVLAALGPRMLDLARERAGGAHTYFVTPQHTSAARAALGPDRLLAPEVAVVVEPDPEAARRIAREYARTYLGLTNYTANLQRFGYTENDVAGGGSDRLIDAVIPHGTADEVAAALRAHLDAGADHVAVQALGHGPSPVEDLRAIAAALG
jgi:probable F420-dependent oxidoreductase